MPNRRLVILASISGIESVALLGYAVFDIYGWIQFGLTGPSEVSNVPGMVLQIAIFALLGAGLAAITWAWLRARRWARAPFITVQAIALIVGWPLANAAGSVERWVGIALFALAAVGIIVALSPRVTRLLQADS
jgi:hypothetical protein